MSVKKEISRKGFTEISVTGAGAFLSICKDFKLNLSGFRILDMINRKENSTSVDYYQIYLTTLDQIKSNGNVSYYQYFKENYVPQSLRELRENKNLSSVVEFSRAFEEPVCLREEAILPLEAFARNVNTTYGAKLFIESGYRSFEMQKELYLNNLKSPKPVIVAKPGHSPHQSGYAIDFSIITDGKRQGLPKDITGLAAKYGLVHTNPMDSSHFLIAFDFINAGVSGKGFENRDYPSDTTYGWNQFLSNLVLVESENDLDTRYNSHQIYE